MVAAKSRPAGITALGLTHFTIGGLTGLWLVLVLVRGIADGIPLMLLIWIGLASALGPVLANAILRGRPWGWHTGLLLWAAVSVSAWFAAPALLERVDIWTAPAAAVPWIGGGLAAAAGLVALYLTSSAAASHFAVGGGKRWVHLALALVVAAGATFGVSRLAVGPPTEDLSAELQRLGEIRASSPEEIQLMLDKLEDGTSEERISAAWALGRSGRGDVIDKLIEVSREDRDVNVRINAVGSIGELGGAEVQTDLVELLDDKERDVRLAALRALASERFAGALPEIGRLLIEEDDLRSAAVDVLGNLGSAEAVPLLQQVAGDEDDDVRTRVAFALGKLRDPRGVPVLTRLLGDPKWEVRANAAQALGMIGDDSARAPLEQARKDNNEHVRGAAESALQKLP